MFAKIQAAQNRLAGHANRTPVMSSRTLNQMVGAEIYFKCENFQRVGAYKFRGAFNAMSQLTPSQKSRGVIAYSSGNHAQAVALVGRLLNIGATIVMPANAPKIKRRATAAYGATIVSYDPDQPQGREDIASDLQARHGYTLIPPFDHEDIVAGQGTAALELFSEIGNLDALLAPCGGGGLLSGTAICAKSVCPACRVIGIEPEAADDATRSFRTQTLQRVTHPLTIADGVRTPSLGRVTFPLVLNYVDDMQTVTEQAIMDAIAFFFYRMKLVVEPSGALGLAALLSGTISTSGRIGVIISGGNIDADTLAQILTS